MAKQKKYRLEVLLVLKDRAKKRSERDLAIALKRWEEEKKKLKELEDEKIQIQKRIAKEKQEMRTKVSSGQAKIKDPQVHLNFIRKLEEDLEAIDKKIEEQKDQVRRAEKQLQRCRSNYILAAQEMNMMEKHKELWTKKQQRELTAQENKMLNELGNTIFQTNKMR